MFCDVGQGDAAYIRFPDGRDMVVDGGPNDAIQACLGRHMPFWDKHIDIVALTHPQKDHMQGLIGVFERFSVDYFLRSDIVNATDGFGSLMSIVQKKHIPMRFMTQGDELQIDATSLSFVWPTKAQIAKMHSDGTGLVSGETKSNVLGSAVDSELNDGSLVFVLHYGDFDALFTGDADSHVEPEYMNSNRSRNVIEVLKVPHHGSKTGMTSDFIRWIKPTVAVVSVGKNSYGHPYKEAVNMLQSINSRIYRTDEHGDVEVVSDGSQWMVSGLR